LFYCLAPDAVVGINVMFATGQPLWNASGSQGLEVHLLGILDFDAALVLQGRLANELRDRDDRRGVCLVCEHPPLITVGRDGSREDILCDPAELTARQLEVRWLERGGGCLMHGPGQIALYPILPIDRLGCTLAGYRDLLARVACLSSGEQRVAAEVAPATGSIVCRSGQLGQVGVSVRSGISRHGVFLNVCPWPDWLRLVDAGRGRQSSLAIERQAPIGASAVRESLVRHLARELGYERVHLFTGHPLLKRTRKVVAYA